MHHSVINTEAKPKAGKSNTPVFAPAIQKKLAVGAVNDAYEVEADTMADKVMRMPDASQDRISHTGPLVQKKCSACEEEEKIRKKAITEPLTVQRKCAKCEEEEKLRKKPLAEGITPLVQRSAVDNGTEHVPTGVESQIHATKGNGSLMDMGTKDFMENRFGTDFSEVRIHTNSQAAQMSQSLNAQAFTVGNDIYFNEGKYNPGSASGKHLLAHELTHTVQQTGGASRKVQKKAATVPKVQRNIIGDIGRGIGSAASTAWDHTGGAVIRFGGRVIEWAEDRAADIINSIAPGLLDFLRGNIWEQIKDMIARGLDAMTGGLFSRLQEEGLHGVIHSFVDSVMLSLRGEVADACRSFARLAEKIFSFLQSIGGAALARLRATFNRISGVLNSIWSNYGRPALDAIKHYAGAAWDWIVEKARWLWDLIAPIRNAVERAWNWIKRMFNIAWNTTSSVLDWLSEKATQAWNWIKQAIEPIRTPLMIIGGIILMLSPLGPFIAIGAAVYGIYRAVQWVRANWDSDVFVRFRSFIQQTIIAPIQRGIQQLQTMVNGAVNWLSGAFARLQGAFMSLVNAVAQSGIFRALVGIVQRVGAAIQQAASFVAAQCVAIAGAIANVAQRVWTVIRPYAEIAAKLIILANYPFLIPIVLAGWAWRILPDCFKPPIINFVLRIMIGALRAMPNFARFGTTWASVKLSIIQFLQEALGKSDAEKIVVTNRVARMVSEMDLTLISNQVAAAAGAPAEFEGQMEEEMLGVNLTAALPFERTGMPSVQSLQSQLQASGIHEEIEPNDAALFNRSTYGNEHIGVDSVGDLAPSPELHQAIAGRTGGGDGTVEFGNSDDRSRTVHGILSEMIPAGGEAEGETEETTGGEPHTTTPGSPATTTTAPHSPLTHEEETERRLQEMMAQGDAQMNSQPCTSPREGAAGGGESRGPEGAGSAYPEEAKFGPLTRGQRARYTLHQMGSGMSKWWQCNRGWLIPTIIGVIIVAVVALVLSGGTVSGAIGPILSALGPIMIGVAALRASYYIGEYIYKSVNGDIPGASKSLARGFAVAAVEGIFALLGSASFWKSIRNGISGAAGAVRTAGGALRTGARAVGSGIRAVGRGAGRVLSGAGRVGMRMLRSTAGGRYLLRTGGAIITRGRLILQGIRGRIGQGMKTLEEFAERLFSRVRFRRFRILIRNGWFRLEGYINPWELLATGRVVEIDTLPPRPAGSTHSVGAIGNRFILSAEKGGSILTRYLEENARLGGRALEQNRELFEAVMRGQLTGSTAMYARAIDTMISSSSTAQRLIANGMPLERMQKVLLNFLRHGDNLNLTTLLSRLERVQRYNINTFERLVAEITHSQRNKFTGGEFLLEFLGAQSNEFLAGIRGFEISRTGRRVDMIIMNGLEFEFKNWGDFRNVPALVDQMLVDFRAGTGLMNSRYVISNRAGSTTSLISTLSTQIRSRFPNPVDAQLAISQLQTIIMRF